MGIGGSPSFPFDVPTTTANARIGRTELGSWPNSTTYAYFGHEALTHTDNTKYTIIVSSVGDMAINAVAAMYIRIANVDYGNLTTAGFALDTVIISTRLNIPIPDPANNSDICFGSITGGVGFIGKLAGTNYGVLGTAM